MLANLVQEIPDATPSSEGVLDIDVRGFLDRTSFGALVVALVAMVLGASMIAAGERGSNVRWATRGKTVVLGALGGVCLIVVLPQLLAALFGLG